MSFLSGTARLKHTTPLPAGTTLAIATKLFRNHDLLIRLDPDLSHYESIPPPVDVKEPNPNTKYYKITDVMHALPANIWDTNVSFTADITNLDNGVDWVVHAPLGLTQKSLWTVERAQGSDGRPDSGEEGEWVLVEDVEIRCSRLLLGTVRNKCEENWKGVHQRFVNHLLKEIPKSSQEESDAVAGAERN